MHPSLKHLLDIQELDIKMLRLMRLKRQREGELSQIESLRAELREQLELKEQGIRELDQQIQGMEEGIQVLSDRYKELEGQQPSIKKVDEFNALTQSMAAVEREKSALEAQASNVLDKKAAEEDLLEQTKRSLEESERSSMELEKGIRANIEKINEEGRQFKQKRGELAALADSATLRIYERLLRNKRDRVIVPIENRACGGCHITLTLQHENLVRKGSSLVFCEHCSRVHYWQESQTNGGGGPHPRRRRRRSSHV